MVFNKKEPLKMTSVLGPLMIWIWTLKPSLVKAKSCGIDQKKFLCGHQNKFNLNCQAVPDCCGHIKIFQWSMVLQLLTALH